MSAAESTGEVALFDVLALLRAARGLLQEPAGDETAETFDAYRLVLMAERRLDAITDHLPLR